jgi:hypothetical protein
MMVKDRVGNVLGQGDKLLIALPESQIFGFLAEIREGHIIQGVRRGGVEHTPGAVLVSCVIALPIDAQLGQVAQCVKVYDPDKHEEEAPKLVQPN